MSRARRGQEKVCRVSLRPFGERHVVDAVPFRARGSQPFFFFAIFTLLYLPNF